MKGGKAAVREWRIGVRACPESELTFGFHLLLGCLQWYGCGTAGAPVHVGNTLGHTPEVCNEQVPPGVVHRGTLGLGLGRG